MHEYTRYHSNISARSLRYTWSTRPHMNTPAHTHTLILLPHPHLHCVQLWERPEHPASTHLPYFFSFLSFILLNSFLSHSQNNNSFSPPPSSLSLFTSTRHWKNCNTNNFLPRPPKHIPMRFKHITRSPNCPPLGAYYPPPPPLLSSYFLHISTGTYTLAHNYLINNVFVKRRR